MIEEQNASRAKVFSIKFQTLRGVFYAFITPAAVDCLTATEEFFSGPEDFFCKIMTMSGVYVSFFSYLCK